ncbi:unnamed protein product [Didymodactylos carnosus]|uniref:CRAL-TRIO domain-containing protein n=1 Tax=Didymodactylos carnosus TaxID=1234261 RepID=A0A815JBT3_9BILA|nr:unnamed protein product [Didymodactylos carnosus]CAF1443463.1 unnamed protein product [Didymodactylos carnosus]CAF4239352.1 unnamed protein product [Didymodactylos carnosus]CAF4265983.1 unnamed protein product [Didymodactylos carnosus]
MIMATNSLLFNINELNPEQQKKFDAVYNELKDPHRSYVEYKLSLSLRTKLTYEEEDNAWRYELFRFLRGRKWNVKNTTKSILDMIQWRIDNHVDSILEDQNAKLRMDRLEKVVPCANHGYTKVNRPLYIEKSGQINVDEILQKFTTEELIQCHIYWLEYYCQLTRERSQNVGQHIESFAIIYDLNHMKMDIRKVFEPLKQCLYIEDNYYPERLGQMFVVNPPRIFPAVWNLIKHFIDPVTKSKILVIKKGPETSKILLENINSDQLPSEYGGTCHSCSTSPDCIPVHHQKKDNDTDKDEEE